MGWPTDCRREAAPPARPRSPSGSFHVDERSLGGGLWDREPVSSQGIDVKTDRLANQADHLITRLSDGDAAGEIGHVGAPARFTTLDDHHVPRHSDTSHYLRP